MGFQDQFLLNAGQKYCRMLKGEHSAILLTCIELPHGFKTFVLSIFEWPLKTGFTVCVIPECLLRQTLYSEDTDEMQHNAAFHQVLHYLPRP